MGIRKVVWDEGMRQESVQYIDEVTGKDVTQEIERQNKPQGEVWDRGMPQESVQPYVR
jgi:hypothetical protein